ncbi:MAG: sugar ABC transporter ATP-binding protein [Candidatus Omnitrophota bacterium]|jgi:ribose transport system ATP-binding protein|nr:MAG: sugar ABC transporter ATP-binding protein [Candidatus Omnitrophota bacterium]
MKRAAPFLEMIGITKTYPGVQALKNVNFRVGKAEIHALVGENGAGKSTLMKILAGAEHMDSGEIKMYGRSVSIDSPHCAQELGIAIIYQEFNLVPQLGAAENIFLGREPKRFGFVDFKKEKRDAEQLLQTLGISLDLDIPVQYLSVAQQQMVEIAKALSVQAKIIAMDEPSATLTQHELKNLFTLIRTLKDQGVSVIYISHRLEEIFEICDRLTVLRDGERIGVKNVDEIDRDGIIEMMVGRQITDEFPKETFPPGPEILRVKGLSRGFVKNVSFSVHRGEIVALTGLVGAGRTEIARMIFGADPPDAGKILLAGKEVRIASPRQAIDHGICLLTEDRKNQGLILGMNIRENITLPTLRDYCRCFFIAGGKERRQALQSMRELRIKAPSGESEVRNLSGGNQQKTILAKWLHAKSALYLFDEPTRGIDVGAKREIYLLMNELLRQDAGILMISSELPEALGMADRVLVMSCGRLVGELTREEATQEKIMDLATGAPHPDRRIT